MILFIISFDSKKLLFLYYTNFLKMVDSSLKKRLEIEREGNKIKIYEKKLIKEYEYSKKINEISNFNTQTKANKKVIIRYYLKKERKKNIFSISYKNKSHKIDYNINLNLIYKDYRANYIGRKRLFIDREDDRIKIYCYPYKNNPYKKKLVKDFEYDEKVKKISSFKKQKKANEEVILNYYKNKSKEKYIPTSKKEFAIQLKEIKRDKRIRIKQFSKSRIKFSSKKLKINFDYMYVIVKVKIYLDGYSCYAKGRSDYFYSEEMQGENKVYPSYRKGIPQSKLKSAIEQASLRAIAPFGSDVKFRIYNWYYAYHQQQGYWREK